MSDRELRTAKIWLRVEPSQLERWQQAIDKRGDRVAADFYRDAIDRMADTVLKPRGKGAA